MDFRLKATSFFLWKVCTHFWRTNLFVVEDGKTRKNLFLREWPQRAHRPFRHLHRPSPFSNEEIDIPRVGLWFPLSSALRFAYANPRLNIFAFFKLWFTIFSWKKNWEKVKKKFSKLWKKKSEYFSRKNLKENRKNYFVFKFWKIKL